MIAPNRAQSIDWIELWYLNCEQTNDLCWTELIEIGSFDDLTVCKQMMFNWIIRDT